MYACMHVCMYICMYVSNRIKQEWKRAIRSGKIVEKKADILNRRFNNFGVFISVNLDLSDKTWKDFVNDEEAYWQSLASRKVEYRKFVCKGDYQQWIKVNYLYV